MNHKLSVTLAVAAGLVGGLCTRYIAPPAAFAQNQAPVTKEIRAQSFTLVDAEDRTIGTFSAEPVIVPPPGLKGKLDPASIPMRIVLRDARGRQLWSAGEPRGPFHQLSEKR